MNSNKKNSEIYLEKAKIVASIMNLADFMYEKNDLSSRTAAILIYFNLIEYLLCFMVRNLKINIQTNEFEKKALGGKINLLNSKKINFYEKEKLIDILNNIFEEYKDVLRQILCKVGDVYKNYFIRLIGLAESGWSSRKEENLYQEWILNFFPDMAERTDKLINDLLARCENAGLSTMGLRLMTWLSLINTSIDTSMGGMNTKCCGIPR